MEVRLYITFLFYNKNLGLQPLPLHLSLEISNDSPQYAGKDILWKQN